MGSPTAPPSTQHLSCNEKYKKNSAREVNKKGGGQILMSVHFSLYLQAGGLPKLRAVQGEVWALLIPLAVHKSVAKPYATSIQLVLLCVSRADLASMFRKKSTVLWAVRTKNRCQLSSAVSAAATAPLRTPAATTKARLSCMVDPRLPFPARS